METYTPLWGFDHVRRARESGQSTFRALDVILEAVKSRGGETEDSSGNCP